MRYYQNGSDLAQTLMVRRSHLINPLDQPAEESRQDPLDPLADPRRLLSRFPAIHRWGTMMAGSRTTMIQRRCKPSSALIAGRCLAPAILIGLGIGGLGCTNHPTPTTSAPGPRAGLPDRKSESMVSDKPPVEIMPRAVAQVAKYIESEGITGDWHLRLEACGPKGKPSPMHLLSFDVASPSAADHTFVSRGIRVVVLKRQVEMLRGTRVGYGQVDGRPGFLIDTPHFEGESLKNWGPVLQAASPSE